MIFRTHALPAGTPSISLGAILHQPLSAREQLQASIALGLLAAILIFSLLTSSSEAGIGHTIHGLISSAEATTADDIASEEESAADTPAPLTPKMQAALDYAARRYKVSSEALQPIFSTAQQSAQELKIDPLLIVAVIAIESRFNPFSESDMGAQGLMQVIPRYHKEKLPENAGKLPLFDPIINVQVGARALQEYIRRQGSVVAGLQQFAGAADDPEQGYANKVQAEKDRMENAGRRRSTGRDA